MRSCLLLFAIAGLPCVAEAQVTATGDYLARMDTDRDGRVSLAEYQAWMSYAFEGMDRNRDGVLSVDELPGGRGKPVTREAHLAQLAERFRRQDVDRDGFLSAKELAAPPQ
ncbi:calcium-dependent protein kinase 21 [Pseudoxanthomonas sp. Root630]|uniref:calcium-dependent protein kinase 21 n=1 Tax=Pseudoxanthomonas sp. Root630 TaxID=1736574 RepID=UPI000703863A|nr:calcium-dependent protein kinase 21 [Pseudoxanthomonas sp. Root630]KRA41531.1 calcium-dependent protein kinase 21 [Pseudoxanthomonas sp. Root630]